MKELQEELKSYYRANAHRVRGNHNPFEEEMEAYAALHPEASALELKAAQYEIIAKGFTPVVFRHTPFFSEMGVRFAEYDGTGAGPGGWLLRRNGHLYRDADPERFDRYRATGQAGFHLAFGPFVDPDHHCFPFTAAIRHGLEHYFNAYAEGEQNNFTRAACRGLLAVKAIAEKFADAGIDAARRVPWKRPETFYEGLAAMWFLHEVCASIDGVGMSVTGRPDYTLIHLYEADLAAGRLTRETAYDLICRFMIHTDCKLDLERPIQEQYNRGEQGDTLILGGCDETGAEVCNELSFLFLQAHRDWKLIYPKIHCRFSKNSSQEFLADACREFPLGRNTISFLNDDRLIPALIRAGKSPEDARGYVAGGCWETIVEGCEHSEGANCYFNLARVVDASIHDCPGLDKLDGAGDFEAVYNILTGNVIRTIRDMAEAIRQGGEPWPRVNPAPFFSACLAGCLESRRDYSEGGARYNPHGIPLAGLAVLTDSLAAIRRLCFEEKICTLTELLTAVRGNWEGAELLRAAALASPRFGDGRGSEQLARRFLEELVRATRDLRNERGGPFQLGLYNYRDVIDWAKLTRATPDGRKQGDFLTQGLTPSRSSRKLDLATVYHACGALPLDDFPANSVLTLSLRREGMTPELLAAAVKSCPAGMLQLNCVSREELLDAKAHPERHGDLIVRLYGYSARFVTLDEAMQEEFISRSLL